MHILFHATGGSADVWLDSLRRAMPVAPIRVWHVPRINIIPHISALTVRDESARQIAAKIIALEDGQQVVGLVDQQRGY